MRTQQSSDESREVLLVKSIEKRHQLNRDRVLNLLSYYDQASLGLSVNMYLGFIDRSIDLLLLKEGAENLWRPSYLSSFSLSLAIRHHHRRIHLVLVQGRVRAYITAIKDYCVQREEKETD